MIPLGCICGVPNAMLVSGASLGSVVGVGRRIGGHPNVFDREVRRRSRARDWEGDAWAIILGLERRGGGLVGVYGCNSE